VKLTEKKISWLERPAQWRSGADKRALPFLFAPAAPWGKMPHSCHPPHPPRNPSKPLKKHGNKVSPVQNTSKIETHGRNGNPAPWGRLCFFLRPQPKTWFPLTIAE
jgi:hypothetical protein